MFYFMTTVLSNVQNTSNVYEDYRSMNLEKNNDDIVTATNLVNVEITEWSPLQMTNGNDFSFGNFALVILNTQIKLNVDQMVTFWNKAAVRVTVDGGTDHWYSFQKNLSLDTVLVQNDPDLVTGDFDSISKDVLDSCNNNSNVKVIPTMNQDYTDFLKSIEEVVKNKDSNKLDSIVAIVEHCGRLDQILANIDVLYRSDKILGPGIFVFLLNKNSLTWLLKPGYHILHIPMRIWQSNYWCGLIPFSGPTLVTTTGLKWDLNKQVIKFGELISSSNTYGDSSYQREGVTIKTDKDLIWTMAVSCEED
ncbi:thiamine pyrophosphokinase 1-like isoform X2 [Lycorma delicatula]|uniref:thiamine pyrophosphokinase 1-like isoform X2 n=1 Tax=Lycorma delicatula TaxID=130591 RepID=UPI003F510DEB